MEIEIFFLEIISIDYRLEYTYNRNKQLYINIYITNNNNKTLPQFTITAYLLISDINIIVYPQKKKKYLLIITIR